MDLNHLHIKVKDLAGARYFFEHFFQFHFAFDHGDGVFLKNAEGFLLAIDPLEHGDGLPTLPEWFHLGFCLPEPDTVRNLFAEMKSAGVKFARELREFDNNAVNFYCWAPGGYKLEVSWNRNE